LKLVGQDGNAYNILGLAKRAGKRAGWTKDQWTEFLNKAIAGNYDHLLRTCMEYFDVD
jgi:hypothetical protein